MVPLLFAFTGAAKKTVKANDMGVQFVLPLPSADSLRARRRLVGDGEFRW
jgi:hypothetical protein